MYKFASTNEVWVVTRCRDADGKEETCTISDSNKLKGGVAAQFVLEYDIVTVEQAPEDDIQWSLYITIVGGFSLMSLAFLYFEWKAIYSCMRKFRDKVCGRTAQGKIGFVDGDPRALDSEKISEVDEGSEHEMDGSHED